MWLAPGYPQLIRAVGLTQFPVIFPNMHSSLDVSCVITKYHTLSGLKKQIHSLTVLEIRN